MKLINLTENGDCRGKLVAVENSKQIPFDIKRIFYIYGTEASAVRGKHANRYSCFAFICIKGSCVIRVIDRNKTEEFILDNPKSMLLVDKMTWKEMYDFSGDSILLVLSNHVYDKDEYIYDYEEFEKEVLV